MEEADTLATCGKINPDGLPATELIHQARELFNIAHRAPSVCEQHAASQPAELKTCETELRNAQDRVNQVARQLQKAYGFTEAARKSLQRAYTAIKRAESVCVEVPLTQIDEEALHELLRLRDGVDTCLRHAIQDRDKARELFVETWDAGVVGRRVCDELVAEERSICRRLEVLLCVFLFVCLFVCCVCVCVCVCAWFFVACV
jgi:hypothetical protein